MATLAAGDLQNSTVKNLEPTYLCRGTNIKSGGKRVFFLVGRLSLFPPWAILMFFFVCPIGTCHTPLMLRHCLALRSLLGAFDAVNSTPRPVVNRTGLKVRAGPAVVRILHVSDTHSLHRSTGKLPDAEAWRR